MDADVIVQLMISQQLLSEDIVMTAPSLYNKNRLILEQVRLMNTQTMMSFCELLKGDQSQREIGETMFSGKYANTFIPSLLQMLCIF